MKHTSTIIYYGDDPVGYDLIEEGNLYLFKPSILKTDHSCFPEIKAMISEATIQISIDDETIKEQVCKLIKIASLLKLEGKLTAAS